MSTARVVVVGVGALGARAVRQLLSAPGIAEILLVDTEKDLKGSVDFKMFNSLIGVVLLGTILGWVSSTYVPLLPGWLGALGTAGFLGYLGTLKDAIGDMLR